MTNHLIPKIPTSPWPRLVTLVSLLIFFVGCSKSREVAETSEPHKLASAGATPAPAIVPVVEKPSTTQPQPPEAVPFGFTPAGPLKSSSPVAASRPYEATEKHNPSPGTAGNGPAKFWGWGDVFVLSVGIACVLGMVFTFMQIVVRISQWSLDFLLCPRRKCDTTPIVPDPTTTPADPPAGANP